MKVGVIVFPGSNCDRDTAWAFSQFEGVEVEYLWHKDGLPADIDLVVLPGGFSYGDYLRTGAFARFSPIMNDVIKFAHGGGLVLGICNGFQVLLESGLLPGAMLPNRSLRFICDWVHIRVERTDTPFTRNLSVGDVLKIPIAHFEGNYFADAATLETIENNRQVVFRYSDPEGRVDQSANPNGSLNNIAGLVNEQGNVLGMMPHPERAASEILGSEDGKKILRSIVDWAAEQKEVPGTLF